MLRLMAASLAATAGPRAGLPSANRSKTRQKTNPGSLV
jgi:hypothetical protein